MMSVQSLAYLDLEVGMQESLEVECRIAVVGNDQSCE